MVPPHSRRIHFVVEQKCCRSQPTVQVEEIGTVGRDGTLSDCERSFSADVRNYFNLKAMKIFSIAPYRHELDL